MRAAAVSNTTSMMRTLKMKTRSTPNHSHNQRSIVPNPLSTSHYHLHQFSSVFLHFLSFSYNFRIIFHVPIFHARRRSGHADWPVSFETGQPPPGGPICFHICFMFFNLGYACGGDSLAAASTGAPSVGDDTEQRGHAFDRFEYLGLQLLLREANHSHSLRRVC